MLGGSDYALCSIPFQASLSLACARCRSCPCSSPPHCPLLPFPLWDLPCRSRPPCHLVALRHLPVAGCSWLPFLPSSFHPAVGASFLKRGRHEPALFPSPLALPAPVHCGIYTPCSESLGFPDMHKPDGGGGRQMPHAWFPLPFGTSGAPAPAFEVLLATPAEPRN